jgi:hypothetical protein
MGLDEQLAELLGRLGVTLEDSSETTTEVAGRGAREPQEATRTREQRSRAGQDGQPTLGEESVSAYQHPGDWEDDDMMAQAELSLFQTSREHYGVFYRLDLVGGAPHLRVFAPDEEGALKMRCYLVRAAQGAPVRDWFLSTRGHHGSAAFGESRDTIEQHLLFAAGEALKRLCWSGEPERMRFPHEIEVDRVA